jgi:peptidoglycan/LPS O-acetylase OafA/YrhL
MAATATQLVAPESASNEPGAVAVRADQRIPSLDGLRAVASLMVVAYHFGPHIVRTQSPFSFLHALPQLMWSGVDLFFVLSGFLIAGILLDARQSSNYFKVFYIRRAFRIFPLYYLVLFAYIGTVAILGERTGQLGRLFENPISPWAYLFYLQNFAMTSAAGFGPIWLAGSWSLAVEEQFYATLPLLIRKLNIRVLMRVVVATFFGAPILRAAIQKFRFIDPMAGHVLLPTCVDSLAAGVLVALLVRDHYSWITAKKRQIRWGTVACLLAWIGYQYMPNPQAIRLAFILRSGNAIVFAGVLLVILMHPKSAISRFLATQPMRQLGNMAYSTYLFHPILLCVAFRVMTGHDPELNGSSDLPALAAALLSTLALSFLSWRIFERPLLSVGHRYAYQTKPFSQCEMVASL